jgi:hypothetical protein
MTPQRHFGPRKRTRKDLETSAVLFLCSARSLDGVTAADIARRYGIKPERAEAMLEEAKGRRG